MVPLVITVNNKMLPQDPGKAMTFTSGGAAVQSSQISGSLNGLNNVTMMGWCVWTTRICSRALSL